MQPTPFNSGIWGSNAVALVCRLIPHPECEVVVSSFGGAMTSMFYRWLERYKSVNATRQGTLTRGFIKHALYPPISVNRQLRLVYLFDDPILSLLSIFKRRCQYPHLINMSHNFFYGKLSTKYKLRSLESYLNSDMDVFPMRQQFHNWQTEPTQHPILFIRSSAVWDNLDHVQSFLGLPDKAIASFPRKKKRRALYDSLSPVLQDKIKRLYGDFQEEVKRQPDVRIRQADWFDS